MKRHLAALALALGALTLPLAASAQTATQKDASAPEQTEQRITLETATSLLNYGRAKGDPLAILTSARLMSTIPARVVGADGNPVDLEAVLDEAVTVSGGDASITALAEATRGELGGADRGMCYWQYQCYWNGYCEYLWWCY